MASSGDVLGRVGTFLMRKSPRATVWTAGITSSGYLADSLGFLPGDFSAAQALAAPILVGGTFLTIGVSLRYIPSTLWRRLTIVAEANDLNLMEDYRKSQLEEHLDRLWDRVFSYEAALRYSPQQREAEGTQLTAARQQMTAKIGNTGPRVARFAARLAQQRQGFGNPIGIDIVNRHSRALGGKAQRHMPAHARPSARDQNRLPL